MSGQVHGTIHNPEHRAIHKAEGLTVLSFSPLAPDADWFLTTDNPATGASTMVITTFTEDECPGVPVCPVGLYTEVSGTDVSAVSFEFKGIDQFGDFVTETVTGIGGGPYTGSSLQAFRKLTQLTVTITGTSDVADTLVVGFAKNYGVGRKLIDSSDVFGAVFNGSKEAGAVNVPNSTYLIAGTPDAVDIMMLSIHPGYYTGKQQ